MLIKGIFLKMNVISAETQFGTSVLGEWSESSDLFLAFSLLRRVVGGIWTVHLAANRAAPIRFHYETKFSYIETTFSYIERKILAY